MPSPGASRRNLAAAVARGRLKRLRSDRETAIIKLLIWQWCIDPAPKPSQRALARQLGVRQPYVNRVLRRAAVEGRDALVRQGQRVTLDDLAAARRFTAKLRDAEPGLLAPAPQAVEESSALTTDEHIAETWREVAEWKCRNYRQHDTRRRIRIPIPH